MYICKYIYVNIYTHVNLVRLDDLPGKGSSKHSSDKTNTVKHVSIHHVNIYNLQISIANQLYIPDSIRIHGHILWRFLQPQHPGLINHEELKNFTVKAPPK